MGKYLEDKLSKMTRSELIEFILYAESRYRYRMTEALDGYELSKAVEYSRAMKPASTAYEKWMAAKGERVFFEGRMKYKYHLKNDKRLIDKISEDEKTTYTALIAKERELMDRYLNGDYQEEKT